MLTMQCDKSVENIQPAEGSITQWIVIKEKCKNVLVYTGFIFQDIRLVLSEVGTPRSREINPSVIYRYCPHDILVGK